MTVKSLTDPTIVNSQFNPDGSLNQSRLTPRQAGFGAVNGWQGARSLQLWVRFTF